MSISRAVESEDGKSLAPLYHCSNEELVDRDLVEQNEDPLQSKMLPNEILLRIFLKSSHKNICQSLRFVCKQWYTLSQDNILWSYLDKSLFGGTVKQHFSSLFPNSPLMHKVIANIFNIKATIALAERDIETVSRGLKNIQLLTGAPCHLPFLIEEEILQIEERKVETNETKIEKGRVKQGGQITEDYVKLFPFLSSQAKLKFLLILKKTPEYLKQYSENEIYQEITEIIKDIMDRKDLATLKQISSMSLLSLRYQYYGKSISLTHRSLLKENIYKNQAALAYIEALIEIGVKPALYKKIKALLKGHWGIKNSEQARSYIEQLVQEGDDWGICTKMVGLWQGINGYTRNDEAAYQMLTLYAAKPGALRAGLDNISYTYNTSEGRKRRNQAARSLIDQHIRKGNPVAVRFKLKGLIYPQASFYPSASPPKWKEVYELVNQLLPLNDKDIDKSVCNFFQTCPPFASWPNQFVENALKIVKLFSERNKVLIFKYLRFLWNTKDSSSQEECRSIVTRMSAEGCEKAMWLEKFGLFLGEGGYQKNPELALKIHPSLHENINFTWIIKKVFPIMHPVLNLDEIGLKWATEEKNFSKFELLIKLGNQQAIEKQYLSFRSSWSKNKEAITLIEEIISANTVYGHQLEIAAHLYGLLNRMKNSSQVLKLVNQYNIGVFQ
ncbi:MAG: F-box protein [Candidatus Paracaedibacteraceae bacterium]|nr:F-box protein [Candidatus Paracaedibacteraceae bacterium]